MPDAHMANSGEIFHIDQVCESPAELLESGKLEQLLRIYNRTMRRQYHEAWRDVPLQQAVYRKDVIQDVYDLWKGRTGLKVHGNAPEISRTDALADETYTQLMQTITLRDQRDIASASFRQLQDRLGLVA